MKKILTSIMSLAVLTSPATVLAQFVKPGGETGLTGESTTLIEIAQNILNWGLGILSVVAVLGFVIAGFLYLTAAGDEERIKTAKRAMVYSIIGLIVGLVGNLAVNVVMNLIGGEASF